MTISFVRRSVTGIAGLALVGGAFAAVAPTAHAAPAPNAEAKAAAAWLASQLGSDGLIPGAYGPDAGVSIDSALVLDAVGTQPSAVARIGAAVAADTSYGGEMSYNETWGDPSTPLITSTASNALAKKVVGLQVAHPSASVLPGLVSGLEGVTDAAGRISDGATRDGVAYPSGNYENIFGQAFAARALVNAGSSEGGTALTYLLSQQCPEGWFAEGIAAPGADAACDPGAEQPSIGGTANALLQLDGLKEKAGSQSAAVATAIADASAWLATVSSNGAFGGAGVSAANANDTGLAGWALGVAGNRAAAEKSALWLAAHQIQGIGSCTAATVRTDAGAVAYDDAAMTDAVTDGISPEIRTQWSRATAQALAALAYLPAAAPKVSAPTGFVAAKSTVKVTVAGLRAGQQACVTGGSAPVKAVANGTVSLTVPAGTATRTLSLTTLGGTTTTKLKVLGATTLKAKASAKKVKRGKKITVTVRGLAAGERVTVKIAGKKFGTATASTSGVAKVKAKVAKKTKVAKKAKITAAGQFANRSGKTTIKVTK